MAGGRAATLLDKTRADVKRAQGGVGSPSGMDADGPPGRTPPSLRRSGGGGANPENGGKEKELPSCKNCRRFTAAPYLHSFSTALDQCKNQSWQTSSNGWIVTPTSAEGGTEAVAESAFCSGDCLFSYLFSRDLLSNQKADDALHFFKRVDTAASKAKEPGLPSPRPRLDSESNPASDAVLDAVLHART